jgi:SAM-dependent methyltransferase
MDPDRGEGPMPSAEEIREGQRAAWAGLSSSWEKWDAVIQEQLAPAAAAMIERLDVREDQQHLDLASGTGEPGLTIARLAPRGHVVLTDLSAEMLAVAARRAEAQGIGNVETRVCSADDLPFAEATFDSASVRFGYMFFPDAAATTVEIARVLRPGGRLAAAVWIEPTRNPWSSVVMEAIATEVDVPPVDPDRPNMYRCAAPGLIGGLFEAAGLGDVTESEVAADLVTSSPEEYWDVLSEHVSIAAAALRQVDGAARARIRERALASLRGFEQGGRVRVPGLARCIAGTKPE